MPIDPVVAEILRCQGKLEAKVEMLESKIADLMGEESESEESQGPEPALATNPAIYSNQLEFDIPTIF